MFKIHIHKVVALLGSCTLFASGLRAADLSPRFVGRECHKYTLKTLAKTEEVGSGFKLQCIRVLGKRVCTKVPTVIHRGCALEAYANICYPTGLGNAITSCLATAAVVSLIPAIVSDGAAAGPSFTGALKVCLVAEGVQAVDQVSAGVGVGKSCGPWH